MTAFTDYVNLELPKRIVLLTEESTGYVGDPNLAVNVKINNAPQGTQFIDNTAPTYRLYVKQQKLVSTSWAVVGSGSAPNHIYVATTGNDGNDGLNRQYPCCDAYTRVVATASGVTQLCHGAYCIGYLRLGAHSLSHARRL